MTSGNTPSNNASKPSTSKLSGPAKPTDPTSLPIYPEYCHSASPTLLKWCPLHVADIHALRDVGMFVDDMRLYHLLNHPIKWIKIVGVVVSIDEFAARNRRVYTLDDGSGMCIECSCVVSTTAVVEGGLDQSGGGRSLASTMTTTNTKSSVVENEGRREGGKKAEETSVVNPSVPWEDIDIGAVVKVKGRVGAFRDVKQVEVVRIEIVRGLDSEVRFWDEVGLFRRGVLGTGWVLEAEEVEGLRRRREKELRRWRRGEKEKERGGDKEGGKKRDRERDRERKGDASGRILEEESRKRVAVEEEGKRKRRDDEKSRIHEEKIERRKEREKIQYPSLEVRRKAAGKYDALGI